MTIAPSSSPDSAGADPATRDDSAIPAHIVRGSAGRPEDGAAVVIGVDGTASEIVLEFGFEHASRHRVPVRAVLCWRLDLLATMSRPPRATGAGGRRGLAGETLAGWQEKFPDVTVYREASGRLGNQRATVMALKQHLLTLRRQQAQRLGCGGVAGSVLDGVSGRVVPARQTVTCACAVTSTRSTCAAAPGRRHTRRRADSSTTQRSPA